MPAFLRWGGGGVPNQLHGDREVVIAYASQSLRLSQRRYCTTHREMLVAVIMCTHFQSYLRGAQFTLRTDHSSLRWLQKVRSSDGMLARWYMLLGQLSVTFEYRSGVQHVNADRMPRQCGQCMRPDCPVSSPDSRVDDMALLDQPFASSEMGDSMDADLLPELSGETWVAATHLDDLPATESDLDFVVASQQNETLTGGGPCVVGMFGIISGAVVLAAVFRESIGGHGGEDVAPPGSSSDVLSARNSCSGRSGSDSPVS